jgi:CHASE3 domain sensor protein
LNTDNYNPDYEYFLETYNKQKHLEEIIKLTDQLEKDTPEHKEYYKTIKGLCNKEINKLQETIDFLCSAE